MTDIVSPLLQWLNANPQLAGLVTFAISAAESVAIIGTIVPGSITMTAIGTLAGAGIIPLWSTIIWAILGAIVGDGISYWMGRYFGIRLNNIWPFKNNPGVLKQGEAFVKKYGVMSVFLGRFVGPVRALVPLVAGMFGMRALNFTIANITSAIGWAPAYMLPGILLGAASTELPPDIAMHFILVLFIMTLFIILCIWIAVKLLQLIHFQTTQFQNKLWKRLQQSKYSHVLTVMLQHNDPARTAGQLTLATYFCLAALLFVLLAIYIHFSNPMDMTINNAMYHLFRGIRNNVADNVMIYITLIGQDKVILSAIAVVCLWLAATKKWRAAIHLFILAFLATGVAAVFKHLVQSPRPWGILVIPAGYSMPSGHTVFAASLLIGLAYFITRGIRARWRWPVYLIALLIAAAVSTSRLYLGAHWFTDVLAGWLLSFALIFFVIISYQRKRADAPNPLYLTLVFIIALTGSIYMYQTSHLSQLENGYTLINSPSVHINKETWWKENESMPALRASLFGFPSQRVNIEWAGKINDITKTLSEQGWGKPPARDWISTIHRVTGISSTQYLPLISPQYMDTKPVLTLTRQVGNSKNLYVIRLWYANRTFHDGKNTPLWVGFISAIPKSYNWIFHRHAGDANIAPNMVFSTQPQNKWETKILTIVHQQHGKKAPATQRIMLIRSK
jgi:membrane protein DedA with SNARE-associated domain/membrane-associated phospholipid phosphatase